jgi:uncharacterized OB-fold protein
MTTVAVPLPVTDDPDTAGFWEAALRRRLAVAVCGTCEEVLHLPTPCCPRCHGWNVIWREIAPTGWVYSFTVVEQSVHPAFKAPYTIALIELDAAPGVRLVGYLDGRVPLQIGAPMFARFDPPRDGVVLPRWERRSS